MTRFGRERVGDLLDEAASRDFERVAMRDDVLAPGGPGVEGR